jgi:nicotinate-nucleotide pyrophosphorylase (carboxylating)
VENLEQLQQAIGTPVTRVLLDNFNLDELRAAVKLNNGQLQLEASGNVTLATIRDIAETGVNFISTGALTKDIKAVDLSLCLA